MSAHFDSGRSVDEQGVEDSFEPLYDINERVRTGLWVGDCFIYNNSSWRLNYCVGGEVYSIHVITTCHKKFTVNKLHISSLCLYEITDWVPHLSFLIFFVPKEDFETPLVHPSNFSR